MAANFSLADSVKGYVALLPRPRKAQKAQKT
jgi:hypothetical protein